MGKLQRRVSTKKKLKEDDQFLKTVKSAPEWFEKNKVPLIAGLVILIAVFSISTWTKYSGRKADAESEVQLYQAMSLLEMGADGEAEPLLEELTRKYRRTDSGRNAVYYLASLKNTAGDHASAISLYDKFLAMNTDSSILRSSALLGKGVAVENSGDLMGAVDVYNEIQEKYPGTYPCSKAMLNAARCWEELGDLSRARECYTHVLGATETRLSKLAEEAIERIIAVQETDAG